MHYQLIVKEQADIYPDIGLLDQAERARYERYLSPAKKLEFLTGRTLLKQTLGAYLGVAPHTLTLAITATGKPVLPDQTGPNRPFFSLAHTEGKYLVGLADCPIGVDIEVPRLIERSEVRHFLTPDEYAQLTSLPTPLVTTLFFRLFTLKEAFLKATDKRWTLDAVECQLDRRQWKLVAPGGSFQVYLSDYNSCYTAVCLDLS